MAKKGEIINRVGEVNYNYQGCSMEIIKCSNNKDCDILFEKTYLVKSVAYREFKKGSIKNPYHPSVYGVGFMGQGKYLAKINKNRTLQYQYWISMLGRCYNEKYHKKQPTYTDCSVIKEWHNFQNFANWFDNNYDANKMDKFQLDKDILFNENKVYSPETCEFAPRDINILFKTIESSGVIKKYNRYIARISIRGKRKVIGTSFEEYEDAHKAYLNARKEYILELAKEYVNKISKRLYLKLTS